MPDVDEVDDVAEPQPVDQVAERAAEQEPERDRQVAGSGPTGRGSRRSGRSPRARPARRRSPGRGTARTARPEFWLIHEPDAVADDAARPRPGDSWRRATPWSAGRGRRPSRRSRRTRTQCAPGPARPTSAVPVVGVHRRRSAVTAPTRAARRNAIVDRAAVELDGRARGVGGRRRRAAIVGQRVGGDASAGGRRPPSGRPPTHRSIRSSSSRPGLAAQVLDRALRARARRPRRAARASAACRGPRPGHRGRRPPCRAAASPGSRPRRAPA